MLAKCPECGYEGEMPSVKIRLVPVGRAYKSSGLQCPKCKLVFSEPSKVRMAIMFMALAFALGLILVRFLYKR